MRQRSCRRHLAFGTVGEDLARIWIGVPHAARQRTTAGDHTWQRVRPGQASGQGEPAAAGAAGDQLAGGGTGFGCPVT
jgi:hypothetical protein